MAGVTRSARHAVVVGGSITGLSAALALSRAGWRVTVLERAGSIPAGMGIGIDRDLLTAVTGADARGLPVVQTGFPATGWSLLRGLLSDELHRREQVAYQGGTGVTSLCADDGEVLVWTGKKPVRADLVVGADGYRSTVRRFVAPSQPDATYSGFVLWRGVVDEHEVDGLSGDRDLRFAIHETDEALLATFAIPGATGDTRRGRRRVVFTWFDARRDTLLTDLGVLDGPRVHRTVRGSETPTAVIAELAGACHLWPAPWDVAIGRTLRARAFIGTPVAEYLPASLVRDRVALAGDAAHVVSPVSGAGFHNALLDIGALTQALSGTADVPEALQRYQRSRLASVRRLVAGSQAWSHDFSARHRPALALSR